MGPTNLFEVPLLSTLAVLYRPFGFIATKILTGISIGVTQANYVEWDRDGFYRVPHTKLAPSAEVNLIDVEGTKKVLNLNDHGLGSYTDQREFKQGGGGLPVLALKMQLQKNGLMLREETDIAATLTDTAVITNNETLGGGAQWDQNGSNPKKDVRRWARQCKFRPNIGACSREVYDVLCENASILEAVKYTNLGSVTKELLARIFELDELFVADGVVNTAEKGQAESLARIWGKDFVLGYRTKEPPSPLLDQPTGGYIVRLGDELAVDGMKNDNNDLPPSYRVYVGPPDPRVGTGAGSVFSKTETCFQAVLTAKDMFFLGKSVIS
jgi:hypothetical protein